MSQSSAARAERAQRERKATGGKLVFLREFLRRPGQLGTCFTSSKPLARAMVRGIGLESARAVVELGPGPGPVTEQIVGRIGRGCKFLAIEQNAQLAGVLRERFPGVRVVEDDAARLEAICRRAGIETGGVDCLVSGVPFLLLDEQAQRRILSAVAKMLRPGGVMTQVTYGAEGLLPKARKFRRVLDSVFAQVTRRRVIANVPPAFVYVCKS